MAVVHVGVLSVAMDQHISVSLHPHMQAKIAFLQGERKGHENLMRDLVRRIKMLEYALKNERYVIQPHPILWLVALHNDQVSVLVDRIKVGSSVTCNCQEICTTHVH